MTGLAYLSLAAALLLLWAPRPWWTKAWRRVQGQSEGARTRSRVQHASAKEPGRLREPGDSGVRPKEELGKARNYVDFARAVAGTWLLFHVSFQGWAPTTTAAPEGLGRPEGMAGAAQTIAEATGAGQGSWLTQVPGGVLTLQVSLLALAVIFQTIRLQGKLSLFAPLFFLSGVVLVVAGGAQAVFGVLLAWTFAILVPGPSSLLCLMSASVLVFGYVFGDLGDARLLAACGLLLFPVGLSLVLHKPLTVLNRRISF